MACIVFVKNAEIKRNKEMTKDGYARKETAILL